MRGAGDGDIRLIASLGPSVDAGGGALIVLVDAGDMAAVPALLEAGATHFLAAPFTPAELRAPLASAQRLVDRLVGGDRKSVVTGKSGSVRVGLCGRLTLQIKPHHSIE